MGVYDNANLWVSICSAWAYQRMRQKCAVFRQQNKKPTGWDLAKTLDKYSERGNG